MDDLKTLRNSVNGVCLLRSPDGRKCRMGFFAFTSSGHPVGYLTHIYACTKDINLERKTINSVYQVARGRYSGGEPDGKGVMV